MALREKFQLPDDPEVKIGGAIVIGAVVFLLVVGRVFRDVNPG